MTPPFGTPILRLIATSDLHAELRDFDYARRRPDPLKGFSRAAGIIARLRAEAPVNLLVDGGDFLHGRPYAALPDQGVGAVMSTMATAGYDAVALGNHDFDGGLSLLELALVNDPVPIVTGNIMRLSDGKGFRPRFRLVQRTLTVDGESHDLIIGLTALLPPATLTGAENMPWDRLAVHPVPQVADDLVREMRDAGADLVIAMCHDGPDSAVALAQAGVDAIAMGHLHGLFPGPGWRASDGVDPVEGTVLGVPAVMPGAWGRAVGAIDLSLTWSKAGWTVAGSQVTVHEVAAQRPPVASAPDVLAASRAVHAAALLDAQRTVAEVNIPLHTYFARLGLCRATRLVAAAAAQAVREAVAVGPLVDRPIIGLAAPVFAGGLGGARNYVDLPSGVITKGDLRDLVPHGDPIWGIPATVADLTLWLERSVSALRQVIPGEVVPELIDSQFPSAAYDLPDSATFDLDLSQPAAFRADGAPSGHPPRRVCNLKIEGMRLSPEATILLAVTEHRMRGGGGFPVPQGVQEIKTGTRGDRALLAYLEAGDSLPPQRIFNFLPIPYAIAMHRIGQGARGYSTDAGAVGLVRTRVSKDGWDSYRLSLGTDPEMVAPTLSRG